MSHRILVAALLAVTLGTASVMTRACDPEQATLDLFRKQGLNLLKPARDYVAVGGLVVRKGGGPMEYIDPFENLPGTDAGGRAFTSAILSEARKGTTTFDLAVKLINGLLPGAVKVHGEASREVKLDQIDATGRRLTYQEVGTLIGQPKTAGEIVQDLKRGLDVFVIQEVYSADALSVSAANAAGLSVTYSDGATIPPCTPPSSDKGKAAGEKPDTAKPGEPKAADTKSGGDKPATGAEKSGTAAKPAAKDTKADAPQAKPDASSSQPSIGFGVCRSGSYSLAFKSAKPGNFMPFAVRLKQIEIQAGKPAIKPGGVAPTGTLATREQTFMLVNEKEPVIGELQRRPKR